MKQASLLALLAFIIIVTTSPQIGVTWDEPAYMVASESYVAWFDKLSSTPQLALGADAIQQYWTINHEHPPIDKIWSGLVWLLSKNALDDLTAHRLGNIILASILLGVLYNWVSQIFSPRAGFFAALALLTMPRFFFHMHLAALDLPVTALTFILCYLFWKYINQADTSRTQNSTKYIQSAMLGGLFGLAIATKINAAFSLVIFTLWALIFQRNKNTLIQIVLMGLVSIPIFFVSWPWLYRDTFQHFKEYMGFVTTQHLEIGQWYLGKFYLPPPWHFPFITLFAVLPLMTFLLALTGIFHSYRHNRSLATLILFSILIPLLALASGQSVVYDNDRLLMTVFPFVAMLAGAGFEFVCKFMDAKAGFRSTSIAIMLSILFILPQFMSSITLYPHLLSYYSEGLGGLRGATKLGFETTYWGESYKSALPYLNRYARPGDVIWVDPWSQDVLIYYQKHGYLRNDVLITLPFAKAGTVYSPNPNLVATPFWDADWILFQRHQTVYGEKGLQSDLALYLGKRMPVFEDRAQGLPIMELYKQ